MTQCRSDRVEQTELVRLCFPFSLHHSSGLCVKLGGVGGGGGGGGEVGVAGGARPLTKVEFFMRSSVSLLLVLNFMMSPSQLRKTISSSGKTDKQTDKRTHISCLQVSLLTRSIGGFAEYSGTKSQLCLFDFP